MNISEVPGLVAKMRDHRFNGYTDTGVAAEIEKFRGGDGIGSIGTAVEALKAVAGALAETDETLRRELGKLGVEWHSEAGGLASRVFTEQAGFSRDAKDKIDHSAEMIFAQGQAFSHTLYRLPDADTVRKGAGGFTLADTALSLIGFETDHVRDVVAANNARAQAVEALNGYAAQSAEILSSIETIAQPQGLRLDSSAGGPPATDPASAVDLRPGAGTGDRTKAAHSAAGPQIAAPGDTQTPAMGFHETQQACGSQPVTPSWGSTAPAGSLPSAPAGGDGVPGRPPRNAAPQPEPGRPRAASAPVSPPVVGAPPGTSIGGVLDGVPSGSAWASEQRRGDGRRAESRVVPAPGRV